MFKTAGNNVRLSNLLWISHLQSIYIYYVQNCWQQCHAEQPALNPSPAIHIYYVQNCWQQCQTEQPACNLSPTIQISVQNCWQQCQTEQPAFNQSPAIHGSEIRLATASAESHHSEKCGLWKDWLLSQWYCWPCKLAPFCTRCMPPSPLPFDIYNMQ